MAENVYAFNRVPMGLKTLAAGPTDKSVGYFHLSLRDKEQIHKKLGMLQNWKGGCNPTQSLNTPPFKSGLFYFKVF